jgi:hypothetical protein
MKVTVDLPDTAPLSDLDQNYAKTALIATLYHVGKLSEKEACLALGVTRRVFEDVLPKFGFSILSDDDATLHNELNL